jgi:tetratricopeptide (TPR) repeat protein
MKRALVPLLALAVTAVLVTPALGAIYEVADKDGNVTHYKYTDRKGSLVFTDNLSSIPESVRKANKVVRVGPPPQPKPPAGEQPPAGQPPGEGGAPAPLPALRDVLKPPVPVPAQPPPEEPGGFPWWLAAVGAGILAGAALAFKMLAARKEEAPRVAAPVYRGRERSAAVDDPPLRRPERPAELDPTPVPSRRIERAAAEALSPPVAAAPRREESPREAIERLVQAGDYAGAAQLCDAQGEIARGADLYLKAGLYAEAAANFEQAGDFARAGESHLKAGDPGKAAVTFARAGDPARGFSAISGYYYEQGDTRQAAAWAEKAGDLVQAATYLQEVGELARAADLFFRGGFHSEAAEIFAVLNELPRAAEAFAKAGRPLEAAQALEKSGGDARRIAELYEQGGGFYPAGRHFVKVGDLDRALAALQQVDAAAAEYPQASLLVGMIFLKRGMTNLAQEKFAKVIGERPIQRATLEPYYFLALCHERSGEPEKARAIFEKILAEDYGYRDVKARLAGRS